MRRFLKSDTTVRHKVMNGVCEDVYFWFDADIMPSLIIQNFGKYKIINESAIM